jgi:hypothetical protein
MRGFPGSAAEDDLVWSWLSALGEESSGQRHIRQHMTARPATIMPAFPKASKEVRVRAL